MAYLIYQPKTPQEKVYELKLGTNTVGRQLDNNIVIPDQSISRYHANIEVTPTSIIVKDNSSLNHTFVNKTEIEQSELKDKDIVTFGNIELIFTSVSSLNSSKNQSRQPNISQREDNPMIVKKISSNQNISLLSMSPQSTDFSVLRFAEEDSQGRTLEKLRILLEVSKQLCSSQSPDRMLEETLELLFKVMDIDRSVILLVNEHTQLLETAAVKVAAGIEASEHFYSKRITELVYQTGDSLITSDALKDDRFDASYSIVSSSIHASICVPLAIKEKIIGVLYVDNICMTSVYSDEDLEFLSCLANQAAAAIHMANKFHQREQGLKQQICQLQIQIDGTKKDREVAEIIESDYFQLLEKKVQRLHKSINPKTEIDG